MFIKMEMIFVMIMMRMVMLRKVIIAMLMKMIFIMHNASGGRWMTQPLSSTNCLRLFTQNTTRSTG